MVHTKYHPQVVLRFKVARASDRQIRQIQPKSATQITVSLESRARVHIMKPIEVQYCKHSTSTLPIHSSEEEKGVGKYRGV